MSNMRKLKIDLSFKSDEVMSISSITRARVRDGSSIARNQVTHNM